MFKKLLVPCRSHWVAARGTWEPHAVAPSQSGTDVGATHEPHTSVIDYSGPGLLVRCPMCYNAGGLGYVDATLPSHCACQKREADFVALVANHYMVRDSIAILVLREAVSGSSEFQGATTCTYLVQDFKITKEMSSNKGNKCDQEYPYNQKGCGLGRLNDSSASASSSGADRAGAAASSPSPFGGPTSGEAAGDHLPSPAKAVAPPSPPTKAVAPPPPAKAYGAPPANPPSVLGAPVVSVASTPTVMTTATPSASMVVKEESNQLLQALQVRTLALQQIQCARQQQPHALWWLDSGTRRLLTNSHRQ
eukprot:6319550-Amphidinium_carterae.2